jgi:hypothetical protein
MARLESGAPSLFFSQSTTKATPLPERRSIAFVVDAALINLTRAGISYQPKFCR